MFRLISLAAGALAAAGALCVTLPNAEAQPQASDGSCMLLSQLQSTRMQGLRILYLRTSSATYRMDFSADCNDVGGEPLIFHPVDNNSQICSALALNVRVRDTGEACTPISLRRLTPEEVAAIPPKYRP